jgi:hypothetical protein
MNSGEVCSVRHCDVVVAARGLRLQYKYTGIPAARIMKPKMLFVGYVRIVLVTMAAQVRTKRAVV